MSIIVGKATVSLEQFEDAYPAGVSTAIPSPGKVLSGELVGSNVHIYFIEDTRQVTEPRQVVFRLIETGGGVITETNDVPAWNYIATVFDRQHRTSYLLFVEP